jgi:hypothetical protein
MASQARDELARTLGLDPRSPEVVTALDELEARHGSAETHKVRIDTALKAASERARAEAAGRRPRQADKRKGVDTSTTAAVAGLDKPTLPKPEKNTHWENTIGNQSVDALFKFRPETLGDVVAIVRFAERHGKRVRAVGSGHSFSDVALAGKDDIVVDTHGLCDSLDLEADLLKPNPPKMFRVEGGIRLQALLETLDDAGFGIRNMGNYAAQTIVGATATGTHGSGIKFGPLASQIQSLDLVAAGGKVYRIEPADGITDPAKFAARQRALASRPGNIPIELVQDDQWFNAAAIGLGCLGIVYSVTLGVAERYWLKETRICRPWSEVKQDLRAEFARLARGEDPVLFAPRHYELLMNPYPTNGQHTCLVTVREKAPEPKQGLLERPHRKLSSKLLSIIPGAGAGLAALMNRFPHLAPGILDSNLKGQEDDGYTNLSYKIHLTADFGVELLDDLPSFLEGYSASMCYPLDTAVDAIDALLARQGAPAPEHMSGPIKIRFVKPTSILLAMQNAPASARAVCMVEPMMLKGTKLGFENMKWVMDSTLRFGGRPHWGLNYDYLGDGSVLDRLERAYPGLSEWLEIYRITNPKGTFDNPFTDRNRLRLRS